MGKLFYAKPAFCRQRIDSIANIFHLRAQHRYDKINQYYRFLRKIKAGLNEATMKQYGKPQAKYATGGKRIGLSGSVFLTVAFLVLCVAVMGVLFIPSASQVQAAPTNVLPTLTYPGTVTNRITDPIIQKTETAIGKEINAIRTLHGLNNITLSSVLSENAYYIAAAMLELGEANLTNIHARGQTVASQLSYINVTATVYVEDYHCTDPNLGAEYFCKTIINHTKYSNAILKSDLKEVGAAILQVPFANKTVTCAVVCSSVNAVAQEQSRVPNPVFKEDATAPVASGERIYLSLGETLTDEQVRNALSVTDERGEVPTITYDLTTINPSIEGEQPLLVTATDAAGNQTACTVPIVVASPTRPVILSETLYVPEIPEGEFWYLAPYVQASDQYGIASVRTEPAFITAETLTEQQMVQVVVTNVYGLTTQAEIPVVCNETAYQVATKDSDSGLCLELPTGVELREEGHALLSCDSVEEGIYHFTVTDKDGVSRTFVRRKNQLVWNPETNGEVEIKLTVYNGKTGSVYKSGTLNIIVADRQVFVYNTIVVSFKPQSGFIIDHNLQWMHKIEPGTQVLALKEAIAIAGSTGEVTVSFVNAKGEDLTDTDIVTTGTAVTVLEDGIKQVSYTVLIYGDTNGDGKISSGDYVKIRQELLKGNMLTDIFLEAADTNHDGKVSSGDYVRIRQFLLGRLEITQE